MRQSFTLILLVVLAACATEPEVRSYDFSTRAGLYVLGYTDNEALRRSVENRLISDIQARNMTAFASHIDLPSLQGASRAQLLEAANARKAMAVLVVNQVIPGEESIVDNPARVTPDHPDLAAFYEYTKSMERNFDPTKEVFAEVNAFLIDGDQASLIWSGTTWSFEADGKGGAISGISENIATELEQVRRALLDRIGVQG